MFRYALRLHRGGMIGYGAALALTAVATGATYAKLAGITAASRAAFAGNFTSLAGQFSALMPAPHGLDTLAGYLLWKGWGALPILVAVWAVLAATGAARGDEDRRLVDAWLAAGTPRRGVVGARIAAFGCAAAVSAAALAAGSLLGSGGPGGGLAAGGLAGQTLAFWLLTVACFALCYLVAQLPASTRAAQAAAGGLLLALYLLEVGGRTDPALHAVAWLSPFKWYDATDALAPGGRLDVAGVILSAALIAAAGLLSALAFQRRDVGGALWPATGSRARARREAAPSRALGWPVARLLRRERGAILMWIVIIGLVSVFMVAFAHTVVADLSAVTSPLTGVPGLQAFFTTAGQGAYVSFIAVFWCGVTQLLLAGLAAQLVSAWASDDTGGILVAALSRPVSRGGVVLERAAAAAVALVAAAAVAGLAAALTAAADGASLPLGRLVGATALLVPFGLTFAAAGAAAGGRWPRAAAGVLGAFAFLSFFYSELRLLMGWPGWVDNFSVFRLYGSPLSAPPYWTGLWVMLAIVAAGFALAVWALRGRDVA